MPGLAHFEPKYRDSDFLNVEKQGLRPELSPQPDFLGFAPENHYGEIRIHFGFKTISKGITFNLDQTEE